jgi:hypothetical protein
MPAVGTVTSRPPAWKFSPADSRLPKIQNLSVDGKARSYAAMQKTVKSEMLQTLAHIIKNYPSDLACAAEF